MYSEYNSGMNGLWSAIKNAAKSAWDKVKSHAGAIIGGAIGGPVGAIIGIAVDAIILDKSSGEVMNSPNLLSKRKFNLQYDEEVLINWLENDIKPWIQKFAVKIDGKADRNTLISEEFRKTVNDTLVAIAYAEMYYRLREKEIGLNASIIGDIGDIDYSENNSASAIMNSYLVSIREAVMKYMEDNDVNPRVKNITVSSDDNVETPHKFDWKNKKAAVEIEIFVSPDEGKKPTDSGLFEIVDNEKEAENSKALVKIISKKSKRKEGGGKINEIQKKNDKNTVNSTENAVDTLDKKESKKVPSWLIPAIGSTLVSVFLRGIIK